MHVYDLPRNSSKLTPPSLFKSNRSKFSFEEQRSYDVSRSFTTCLSGMSRSVCCQSARRSAVGCLSVCLLSVRPSACCRSVCGLSARLSVCCSVRLSAVRSVCLLLVRLAVWRLVGPSVCCRSICLSVCCWSVRPSARPSNCCRPVCLSAVDPSECLSVCCSVRPSCCSVRLSAVGRSVALSVYPSHAMILTCTSNDVIRALSSG